MNTIPDLLQNSVHDNSKKTAVISNVEEYSYKEIDDYHRQYRQIFYNIQEIL